MEQMHIYTLPQIERALDLDAAIAAIRAGFIGFSAGQVQLAAVGHLTFPAVSGDCHIKSASMRGSELFAIKIATGFAQNAQRGLRTSNGMMALFDANTGEARGLLLDQGHLTDIRTAIAGAIAVEMILPRHATTIGIVGTGIQARLQAQMAARLTSLKRIAVWGRNTAKALALADDLKRSGLDAFVAEALTGLCQQADVIITATLATEPFIKTGAVRSNARIVAVGADAPGKQEIDTVLVGKMDRLVADSIAQCLDHGELASAHRAGLVKSERVSELGTLLAGAFVAADEESILVDLTGLGVQDLQIATTVWNRLAAADALAH